MIRGGEIVEVYDITPNKNSKNCLKLLYIKGEVDENSFDVEMGLLLAGKQTYTPDPKKRVYAQIVGMGCPDVAVAETVRLRAEKDKENVKVFDMQG